MDPSGLTQDAEIQNLILQEQIERNINRINDICWDKCIDYVDSSLSRKQENCLSSCVDRFMDTTTFLTQQFNNKLSSGSAGSSSNW